jgi:hypothetical protein
MTPRKSNTTTIEETPIIIKLSPVVYNRADIRIVGTRPLLCDRAPYMPMGGKAPIYTEDTKYEASMYIINNPDGTKSYGFPAKSIKSACVAAARFIPSLTMTVVRGLFFVEEGNGLLEIKHPTNGEVKPKKDCQMVIKKDGKQIPVVRSRFDEWCIDFTVVWQPSFTNQDVIIQILQVAGESIGLGCLRPEKSGRQSYGTFRVMYE